MARYILVVDTDTDFEDLSEVAEEAERAMNRLPQVWPNLVVTAYDSADDLIADYIAQEGCFDFGDRYCSTCDAECGGH